jgi:hypothetical protein
MPRLLFLAVTFVIMLIASAMTPMAHAYLTPDEVIFNDEFLYPPKPSEARERVRLQNARSTAERERIYAELAAERQASSSSAATTNTADAGEASDILEHLSEIVAALQQQGGVSTFQPADESIEDAMTPEERRRERLFERLEARDEEQLHASAWYEFERLHSGAPLAGTGSGTVVVIMVLALAAIWTIRKAAKKGYIEVK